MTSSQNSKDIELFGCDGVRFKSNQIAGMQPATREHNVHGHLLKLIFKFLLLNIFLNRHTAKVATIIVDTTFGQLPNVFPPLQTRIVVADAYRLSYQWCG